MQGRCDDRCRLEQDGGCGMPSASPAHLPPLLHRPIWTASAWQIGFSMPFKSDCSCRKGVAFSSACSHISTLSADLADKVLTSVFGKSNVPRSLSPKAVALAWNLQLSYQVSCTACVYRNCSRLIKKGGEHGPPPVALMMMEALDLKSLIRALMGSWSPSGTDLGEDHCPGMVSAAGPSRGWLP